MKFLCPQCRRPLYDRRRQHCGFCGVELPPDLQFSPAQKAELKQHAIDAEKRGRQRQARQDAAEKRRQKNVESIGPQDLCF